LSLQANPADLLPKLEDAKKEYASLMQQAVEIQRTQMVVYLYLIHLLTLTCQCPHYNKVKI